MKQKHVDFAPVVAPVVGYLCRTEFQITLKHCNLIVHTLMGYTLKTKRTGKTKQNNSSNLLFFLIIKLLVLFCDYHVCNEK